MKYKVIKASPGFNKGDIIDTKDYSWNPELYPYLFERVNIDNYYTTKDGVEVTYSTPVYVIDEDYKIKPTKSGFYHLPNPLIFSTEQAAKDYLTLTIYIEIEDEIVESKDIPIYGVCCIANWQLDTSTSLKLFQRRANNVKESEHWRWFKSESNREEYIKNNKPLYNLNQVITFGKYCYTDFDKSKSDTIEEFLEGCLNKIK